ncbi:hypothetical protein AB6U14_17685 [Klebsiella pneumoniae]
MAVINGTFHGDTSAQTPIRLHEGVVQHLVVDRIGLAVHLLAYFGEKFEIV